jgi:hypothetical protein
MLSSVIDWDDIVKVTTLGVRTVSSLAGNVASWEIGSAVKARVRVIELVSGTTIESGVAVGPGPVLGASVMLREPLDIRKPTRLAGFKLEAIDGKRAVERYILPSGRL